MFYGEGCLVVIVVHAALFRLLPIRWGVFRLTNPAFDRAVPTIGDVVRSFGNVTAPAMRAGGAGRKAEDFSRTA